MVGTTDVDHNEISDFKIAASLGLGVTLILLAFWAPANYSYDGDSMLAVSESLVAAGDFDVPRHLGILGKDGRYYSYHYPLQSILAVPTVAVGVVLARAFQLPTHYVSGAVSMLLPVLYTGITAGIVMLIGRKLGGNLRGASFAALSFAFGTIAFVYARTFFAEPLSALLVSLGVLLCISGRSGSVSLSGAVCGLAVLAKPTGIVLGVALTIYLLLRKRGFRCLIPLLGSGIGMGIYGVYNWLRFGSVLEFGIPYSLFSLNYFAAGILGLLFSPGRGLIWYAPVIVLGFIACFKFRTLYRNEIILILLITILLLGIHSPYSSWDSGWSWGPRFLLPAIAPIVAATTILGKRYRFTLLVLSIFGFLVSGPTLIMYYERLYAEQAEKGSEVDMMWSIRSSPVLQIWGAATRQIKDSQDLTIEDVLGRAGTKDEEIENSQMLRIVAVWWWLLPAIGVPRSAGVVASLCLVALGGCLVKRVVSLCTSIDNRQSDDS